MAEYNPSKIIKDGNTYNFRDTTKIPLAGSNQISGDLIPATTDSVNLGSSVKEYLNAYIKSLTINGVACGDVLTHNASEFVPRSGGAVMTVTTLARAVSDASFQICGGASWYDGGTVGATGKNTTGWAGAGSVYLHPSNGSIEKVMLLYTNGTWTWDGTACQVTSDQRFKQQIAQIDDDLLTAWEDVNPVQFKYNDAVDQKGKDKARLHTGYVVQQIDEACKSHNVDISKYGLYCHEVYQEETREVEHDDGTKTIEVVRPANEHYSLRYTEALIVECAYLRKCIKELRTEIEQLKSSK